MKRFTNHPEPWGEFIDVKFWPEIKHPERYAGKELFFTLIAISAFFMPRFRRLSPIPSPKVLLGSKEPAGF